MKILFVDPEDRAEVVAEQLPIPPRIDQLQHVAKVAAIEDLLAQERAQGLAWGWSSESQGTGLDQSMPTPGKELLFPLIQLISATRQSLDRWGHLV